jgi:iron uptake system component EfeO
MSRFVGHRPFTGAAVLLALLVASIALTACGSDSSSGGKQVKVGLVDSGCDPQNISTAAGPTTFKVVNTGTDKIIEMEVLKGSLILGEHENITNGLSGSFSINLKPGKYDISCNDGGARTPTGTLTVTGSAAKTTLDPQLKKAAAEYRKYVIAQSAALVAGTKAFTAAVDSGDLAQAKKLYETSRLPYERIEPVAESFGDLDPKIDARINDVEPGQKWTGFHPLERALFQKNTTDGTSALTKQLNTDVAALNRRVAKTTYEPAQLANGAVELLNEVSKSKITGEEERYSHVDLSTFKANVDGAREAFELLKPELENRDSKLSADVEQRFDDLDAAIAPYKESGDVYRNYALVTDAQRRKLSQAVDALAQPLAQVGGKIVG